MNKWQRQRQEAEDRATMLTPPRLLTRTIFFGALVALLIWGPWTLVPRLLVCAGGVLAYMALSHSPPLARRM